MYLLHRYKFSLNPLVRSWTNLSKNLGFSASLLKVPLQKEMLYVYKNISNSGEAISLLKTSKNSMKQITNKWCNRTSIAFMNT